MITTVAVAATVVVAGLACYAGWLWWRVFAQKRERETHNARVLAETEADLSHSIGVLADSLWSDELNLSEGAIRLKVLLDHWYAPRSGQNDYPAIYSLYLSTATMPRGGQRDARRRRDIRRLDREREMLEVAARDEVMLEVRRLQACFGVSEARAGSPQQRSGAAAH